MGFRLSWVSGSVRHVIPMHRQDNVGISWCKTSFSSCIEAPLGPLVYILFGQKTGGPVHTWGEVPHPRRLFYQWRTHPSFFVTAHVISQFCFESQTSTSHTIGMFQER